jgi:hypothetical protein
MIFTDGFAGAQTNPLYFDLKYDSRGGFIDIVGFTVIPGRFSRTCLYKNGGATGYAIKNIPNDVHYIMGVAIYPFYNRSEQQIFGTLNGATRMASVTLNDSGNLRFKIGTTLKYIHTVKLRGAKWVYVEIEHKVDATSGVFKVWINDQLVFNQTSGDTRNGTLNSVTAFDIWDSLTAGAAVALDDLYYTTSNGLTARWGDTHIREFFPTSDDSNTGWTLSTGTIVFDIVDNIPTTEGTPNMTATAVNSQFLVGSSENVPNGASIKSVAFNSRIAKNDVGAKDVAGVVKIGATTYQGATLPLSAVDDWLYDPLLLSPATSAAWTVGEVNAMKFGMKVIV